MREHLPLFTDIVTFLIVALVAYPFAFLGVNGEAAILGKVICGMSLILAVLCCAVKRPPPF